jgi:protein SCO1/2
VRRRITAATAAAFLLLVFASCGPRASDLPDYGAVPPFSMVDSSGHPFQGESLAGKVWVADFIYTNCPAECPMMSSRMHAVQKKLAGEDDVRFVSISVDPERDTPEALRTFAARYGGGTRQWIFLTGSPQTVHLLAYTTFHVGDVLGKIEHSTKFILVDRRNHIRGYYSSFDHEGIPAMLKDLAALRRERPPR